MRESESSKKNRAGKRKGSKITSKKSSSNTAGILKTKKMGMSAKEVLELAHKKKEVNQKADQPEVSRGTYFRDFEKRLDGITDMKEARSPKFFLNFLPPVMTKKSKTSSLV